ncbi:Phosphoadenosine phosphosulfate reductase [Gigaspora margarita]|uniref:Phosphoadenosine phosphosulfate reductase n=1 Tax=Gigaspora margarita TaxID=4874 RepID=A0A8H3X8Y0_GIGMA|nr:Phosphoadenosine phosphosulfate reductase [Gigaspora margarita]
MGPNEDYDSDERLPNLFTEKHLDYLNEKLAKLSPKKILEWAIVSLPGLYQTTAFGLTGLIILDIISKISYEYAEENEATPQHLVPLIFVDTLYHFDETLDLANRAASRYNAPLHIYKPVNCETTQDFEQIYGKNLWETDDSSYDYLVKVEPSRRAYKELGVSAIITGRRRSQKGERENIKILEMETGTGLLKLNPLALWDFPRVKAYIRANEVPYNPLLDKGYRSVGDWHSTKPINNDTTSERDGRWQGQNKTECGLHKDYFKMRAAFVAAQKRKVTVISSNTP